MKTMLIAFTLFLTFSGYTTNIEAATPATSLPEVTQPAATTSVPPLAPIGEDIQDWEARWELARLLSFTKRYDESLIQYRKLLLEKPTLQKARLEMASVLSWAGKTEEAVATLRSVPQQDIDKDNRLAFADIFIASKDYVAAEALLVEHLQSSPSDDLARLKLADLLSWIKRYDASLKEYEIILKHQPNDSQVRRKYGYVLIWAGKRDQAVIELRKSLKE